MGELSKLKKEDLIMINPIIYRTIITLKLYYESQIKKEFNPVLSEKIDLINRLIEIENETGTTN